MHFVNFTVAWENEFEFEFVCNFIRAWNLAYIIDVVYAIFISYGRVRGVPQLLKLMMSINMRITTRPFCNDFPFRSRPSASKTKIMDKYRALEQWAFLVWVYTFRRRYLKILVKKWYIPSSKNARTSQYNHIYTSIWPLKAHPQFKWVNRSLRMCIFQRRISDFKDFISF